MKAAVREDKLAQQVESARGRVENLCQRVNASPAQQPLLAEVLPEISNSLKELYEATEELRRQNEMLVATSDLLKAERQYYLELFEFAPDGYLVTDMAGTIQGANRAAARLLHAGQDFLVGKPITVFIPETEHKAFRELLMRLQQGEEVQTWELQMRPRDGASFSAALTVSTVRETRSSEGRAVGQRWLLHDITERKRAEEELRRSEAYLTEGQRLSHTGSWAWKVSNGALFWSQEHFRIFGLDPKNTEPSYEMFFQLVHPEDRPHVKQTVDKAVLDSSDFNNDYRIVLPDGRIKHIHSLAHPVFNESGNLTEYVGTVIDTTERQEAGVALEKAFEEINILKERLHNENLALREEIDRTSMFEEIVGSSTAVQAVLSRVTKVAPMDSTVLITGETGTGKELIARAIHKRSHRSGRPFVAFNCAGTPSSLIASELFGHEKGAFTGALQRRLGRFELAEGGTIFLDEIGELPAETQIALLRVVQEGEFERVGGSQLISTDVRVIAATNRDLQSAVAAGTYRLDLYYRLNVFPIEVPPLRERKEDIPMLLEYFIKRHAIKAGKRIRMIDKKTVELFKSYPWPGNIRELQSVIERSVIVCESDIFSVDESWLSSASLQPHGSSSPLSERLLEEEKKIIESALAKSKGRVSGPSGAAAKLGIPPSTLESKIKTLKIKKHRFKSD